MGKDVHAAVNRVGGRDRRRDRSADLVTDPAFLESLGVDPRDYGLVVVKSGYLSPAHQAPSGR